MGYKHIEPTDMCWCNSGKMYKDCHQAFDRKLSQLSKNHRVQIPTRDLIKTEHDIELIRKAAEINNAVLDLVTEVIHEGMSTDEINELVHNKTIELGGIPAPLNFEGFPKSCCTSINDQVCHGIPSKKDILKSGDIVNVDCTTIYEGHYADASRMYLIGNVTEDAEKLVRVVKESMDLVVKNLKPFDTVGDIGNIIQTYCHNNGYTVVREVGGHGVGNDFHEDPFIYHVGKKGEGAILAPGMVFTIEPMVNMGKRHVCLDNKNGWTIYTVDGSLSAQWEYTVLMTDKGLEIIAY